VVVKEKAGQVSKIFGDLNAQSIGHGSIDCVARDDRRREAACRPTCSSRTHITGGARTYRLASPFMTGPLVPVGILNLIRAYLGIPPDSAFPENGLVLAPDPTQVYFHEAEFGI
jgi:hypothetical protein